MKELLLKCNISELLKKPNMINISLNEWASAIQNVYGKVFPKNLIKILKAKINLYDVSEDVNCFLINDLKYWLDKATRVGLMNLINCSKDNIQLVLGDEILELDLDKARNFLAELEVYASKCYVNTQKHLIAVKKLMTVEDIINYDYTTGYPEKIILNV